MTAEEFETKRASTGGKWIKEPGTYNLIIKKIDVKGPNKYDTQWVDLVVTMESAEGAEYNQYLTIPTTAEKSYLFGSKKTLYAYNDVDKFLLGLGIKLDYNSAISQLEALFEDMDTSFIGSTITLRLGFRGNRLKYSGKENDSSIYVIVDKDDKVIVDKKFTGHEAAKAYADEAKIKLQDFIKCLEVVPATTVRASNAPKLTIADLPF
jgi:hypothetical protein